MSGVYLRDVSARQCCVKRCERRYLWGIRLPPGLVRRFGGGLRRGSYKRQQRRHLVGLANGPHRGQHEIRSWVYLFVVTGIAAEGTFQSPTVRYGLLGIKITS